MLVSKFTELYNYHNSVLENIHHSKKILHTHLQSPFPNPAPTQFWPLAHSRVGYSSGLLTALYFRSVYFSLDCCRILRPWLKSFSGFPLKLELTPMSFSKHHELYPLPSSSTPSQDSLGKKLIIKAPLGSIHNWLPISRPLTLPCLHGSLTASFLSVSKHWTLFISRLMHVVFPLRSFPSPLWGWLFFDIQLKCHLLRKAFPDLPN